MQVVREIAEAPRHQPRDNLYQVVERSSKEDWKTAEIFYIIHYENLEE